MPRKSVSGNVAKIVNKHSSFDSSFRKNTEHLFTRFNVTTDTFRKLSKNSFKTFFLQSFLFWKPQNGFLNCCQTWGVSFLFGKYWNSRRHCRSAGKGSFINDVMQFMIFSGPPWHPSPFSSTSACVLLSKNLWPLPLLVLMIILSDKFMLIMCSDLRLRLGWMKPGSVEGAH